jgi:hypothetical protein
MFRSNSTSHNTTRCKGIVAAFALAAGLAGLLISVAPEAKADVPVAAAFAKADRLPLAAKPCSLTGWPNYEASCYFDRRTPSTEARTVRMIALR